VLIYNTLPLRKHANIKYYIRFLFTFAFTSNDNGRELRLLMSMLNKCIFKINFIITQILLLSYFSIMQIEKQTMVSKVVFQRPTEATTIAFGTISLLRTILKALTTRTTLRTTQRSTSIVDGTTSQRQQQ
jgi:hypothetical protein